MKKIIICAFALLTVVHVWGQEDKEVNSSAESSNRELKNNELKLNIGSLIFSFPEFNYERIFAEDMGVGMAVAFALERDLEYQYSIIPYYRMYFGRKRAAGFFIEANMALMGQQGEVFLDYDEYYDEHDYRHVIEHRKMENSTNFGAGFAFGLKWVTVRGFVGEIYLGGGRLFGETAVVNAYPRAGVSLGKRF